MVRRIAIESSTIDAVQIVEDSKCCLKVNAVITKVGVYDYPDGRAFKSPMELLRATRTARAAKLTVLQHPPDPTPVVMSPALMKGTVEKPFFDRDKIRAQLNFDKHENTPEFLDSVHAAATKTGKPLDVSIGFYYESDGTPGTWKDSNGIGHPYDYTMHNILIDHVACGVPRGRCSYPDCGIGVDSLIVGNFRTDYSSMEECIADNGDKENPAGFCAWLLKQTGQCTQEQIDSYMKRLKEKVTRKMSGDPKETFIKARMGEGLSKEEAEAQYVELTSVPNQKGQPEDKGTEKEPTSTLTPEQLVDADYPWDQCVADRLADGYSKESAESICNAIKLRTVSHASEFYGLTLPQAVKFIVKKCATDKLFKYALDSMTAHCKADEARRKGKDQTLEAQYCAVCGTKLVDNKCPNKDCTVFDKIVEASSDAKHGADSVATAAALPTAELVERSQNLVEMKEETDKQAIIASRKPR